MWAVLAEMKRRGQPAVLAEGYRSDARQAYLFKFGREYDDGRGIVTKAANGRKGWHLFCLAADITSAVHGDDAPQEFWDCLRESARAVGLRSGDDWDDDGIPVEKDPDEHFADKRHVQWRGMRVTPSDHAWELLQRGGVEAVWAAVGAD